MSYVEHEWTNGELITADKLNNMEEGIAEASQNNNNNNVIITFSHSSNNFNLNDYDFIYIKCSCDIIKEGVRIEMGGECYFSQFDSIIIPLIGDSIMLYSFSGMIGNEIGSGWIHATNIVSSSENIIAGEHEDTNTPSITINGSGSITIVWEQDG